MNLSQTIQPYLIQNSFIFRELPLNDIEFLKENAKTKKSRRGEILFRQGTFPKGVYWLISGKVKIFQESYNGRRMTTYIHSDGDLIGYRQLIAEVENPVSAVLLEDSEVSFIPEEVIRKLLSNSGIFLKNMLTALAKDFTIWMNRMTVFQDFPVKKRLILALLILHEQYNLSGVKKGIITIERTELAEYVGATLETVVRILNRLKASNYLQIKGRQLLIHNTDELMKLLKENS
ncbi:MAG: Crp/Fnr family transcriptional regulator [Saprospiraceae bacterium]|nr:Crp/Fnr family transcriptional regulator [Saprospiraceae bacterium]